MRMYGSDCCSKDILCRMTVATCQSLCKDGCQERHDTCFIFQLCIKKSLLFGCIDWSIYLLVFGVGSVVCCGLLCVVCCVLCDTARTIEYSTVHSVGG